MAVLGPTPLERPGGMLYRLGIAGDRALLSAQIDLARCTASLEFNSYNPAYSTPSR